MKLKFKQNVYIANKDMMVEVGQEVEIEDEVQAQSIVDADYAEAVEEAPKKKAAKKGDK